MKYNTFLAMFILFISSFISYGEDYDSLWLYSKEIYINTTSSGADVSNDVLNYPLLVRLNGVNFNFPQAKSDGSDIRFAKSDSTHLNYEIERWDNANEEAVIWVKMDTVFGDNSSQYILMYWGNGNAYDSSNREAVFDTTDDFAGVWHLNESFTDATTNDNDGTNYSSTDSLAVAGKGRYFDGNDYINVPYSSNLNTSNYTVSCWVKMKGGAGTYRYAVGNDYWGYTDRGYAVLARGPSDEWVLIHTDGDGFWIVYGDDVEYNEWYYVVGTYNGTTAKIYGDGVYKGYRTTSYVQNNTRPFRIGADADGSPSEHFIGIIDEVRVSKTARSSDWIKLNYKTQKPDQKTVTISEEYSKWSYSKKISLNTTSSGSNVSNDVLDFPVLVRLDSDNFNFSTAKSDGSDIRFSKYYGPHFPYEIERWDNTNEEAEIWVKVDTVYGDTVTHYLKMYWGNSDASDSSNPEAVFDTTHDFEAVWHLNDDFLDATINDYNGTNCNTSDIAGAIADGQYFDGNYDYISLPDGCMVSNYWSLEFWVKPSSPDNYERVFIQGDDGCGSKQIVAYWLSGHIEFGWTNTGTCYPDIATSAISNGEWSHVVWTYNGSTHNAYVNGQSSTSSTVGSNIGADGDNYIGSRYGTQNFWTGLLDEIRVSGSARSADWVKLSYENQKTNQTLVDIAPENYQDWVNHKRIYFNTTSTGGDVSNDVEDFPFLVKLNADNFSFGGVSSDGHDIRFSDPDGTKLPYELELWDVTNNQAAIWVNVPKIDGNSTSDYILMYWGNYSDSITDNQSSEEVFDTNNVGVWHLNEGSGNTAHDASYTDYDGTYHDDLPDQRDGIIHKCQDFDGSYDYISFPDKCDVSSEWSIMFWVKPESPDNFERAFIQGYNGCASRQISLYWYNNHLELYTTTTSTPGYPQIACDTLPNNQWSHVVFSYNGSTHNAYVNGESATLSAQTSYTIDINGDIYIGCRCSSQNYWTGKLDAFRLLNVNMSADWIKLCYENQRPDSKLQLTDEVVIYPIVDGTISNKPNDFEYESDSLKLKYGEDPEQDTIKHAFLRFDLSEALELENMGWALEGVELNLNINSVNNDVYNTVINFGVYNIFGLPNTNRFLIQKRYDGHYVWLSDLSTINGRDTIEMDGTFYFQGLGGCLDTFDNWSWLLFNVENEKQRLFLSDIDSMTGYAGKQDGSSSLNTYIKTNDSEEAPSDSAWKNNGTGVTVACSTVSNETNRYFSIPLDNVKWIWLGIYSDNPDSTCHAVWGDIKLHTKKYKSTNLLLYQVKDEGIDSSGLSFTHMANSIPWRHTEFEGDYDTDSSEGVGTEDLEVVYPGYDPLWNRYQGKYRHRSPLISKEINAYSDSIALNFSSKFLTQAVLKSMYDTTDNSTITLLGVLQDSGNVKIFSSDVSTYNLIPKLKLKYSDSQKLLVWSGRDTHLDFPQDSTITLNNSPSLGDGRYGRVVRFHETNQSASLSNDIKYIDYREGVISFWYQKTLESGNAEDAVFFAREKDSTFFKLSRIGILDSLCFWYGDTTDNIIYYYNNTSFDPFDGDQHFFQFRWDKLENNFILTIDGKYIPRIGQIDLGTDPTVWPSDEITFGANIDGYIENLLIYSKISLPDNIEIAYTVVEDNNGYLPYVQPGFNDTVDCIILSPDDPLFKQELERYALRNIAMGIRSKVVSLDEINKYYAGADVQERIRNFLKRAYLEWHPKVLALGASTNFIPSRKVVFKSMNKQEVATDKYYAHLEGSWNEDGDEYFAEPRDDNPDLTAELIVGRLPANTWSELRTMIEKSTMGFGLPPYNEQCTEENRDIILLTGMQMITSIGNISDGQYYANQLYDVLTNGTYTSNIPIKTYYPNDDPDNDPTDAVESRLNKFIDSLNPLPGLWIHFGHGNANTVVLDMIKSDPIKWVGIGSEDLSTDTTFLKFRDISHIRITGCSSASQDQNSVGRWFLAKPYGGALTYIGTSEYSYPKVEKHLLLEEIKTFADSSYFTWGEIYRKAAEIKLQTLNTWDLARWVILTRNFMGDPLLPVRYKNITDTNTLQISCGYIRQSDNNNVEITITDTNNNDNPVEGVKVGIVSQKVGFSYSVTDSSGSSITTSLPEKDITFAHGITNRYGKVYLSFYAQPEDSVTVTAFHHDYIPARINKYVSPISCALKIEDIRYVESESLESVPESKDDGIVQPGETVMVTAKVRRTCSETVYNISAYLARAETEEENGIYTGSIERFSGNDIDSLCCEEDTTVYFYFTIDSCPAGVNSLPLYLWFTADDTPPDSLLVNIPITGPKVVPVINYLVDGINDFPDAGDNVTMQILLGNKQPAIATNVLVKLITNNSNITIVDSLTDTFDVVGITGSKLDTLIHYSISGDYDEDEDGIIEAQLIITGENIITDTVDIDLNPIRNADFTIDTFSVVVDYQDGVFMRWSPVKYSDDYGRRSDFLGFVVMRSTDEGDYYLLTPHPVTGANYYYDNLDSDDTLQNYTYEIAVVDSSYNCSYRQEVSTTRFWKDRLKEGFPIYTGSFAITAPVIADYDKNGKSEIYAISPVGYSDAHKGRAIGFRADGQEVIVDKRNDGLLTDHHTSNVVFADLNGDGFDEAIYTAGDEIIANDLNNSTTLWTTDVGEGHNYGLEWFCRPTIADINEDGNFEIIAFGLDNRGSGGFASIYVLNKNGTLLAKKDFPSDYGGYQHDMVIGEFDNEKDGLEIILAYKKDLYLLGDLDTVNTTFVESTSVIIDNDYPVYSSISVGNCYGSDNILQIALYISPKTAGKTKGTVKVFEVNTLYGEFTDVEKTADVYFSYWTLWAGAPAMANLDDDAFDEIVFAGDDTIYVFDMTSSETLQRKHVIPYGGVPTNRIHQHTTAQPLIADIDNDDTLEIITTHWGDGNIWALELDSTVCKGFPLKLKGKVRNACNITDLEGDGILDLTAIDMAGHIYAWSLDTGSIYKQPWPSDFNNAWHTGYNGYKPAGTNGHLLEMWDSEKATPYSWIETDTGNSTDEVSYGAFERDEDNLLLKTNDADDRNYHFTGPNMAVLKDYSIRGKIKFDNSSAELGINFYSQWPDEAKKYCIIRESDGFAYLYYVDGSTDTLLATLDTSKNELINDVGAWYNFEIIITHSISFTIISAKIWHDTITKPGEYGIQGEHTQNNLTNGLVGVVTHAGSGYRYWGPISVTSNVTPAGANIAYETFIEDTIVDVKPYVPQNWHPDYLATRFTTGIDSTGFVLDTSFYKPSLIYRHKPGITYPAICRVTPQTNLKWRDYEYSGTIIKPEGNEYDSLEVGAVFYMQGKDDYYKLVARGKGNGGNGFVIMKGDSVLDTIGTISFEGDVDTVLFAIEAQTDDYVIDEDSIEVDGKVTIRAKIWEPGGSGLWSLPIEDMDLGKKIEGYSGIIIDNINIGSFIEGLKLREVTVTKIIK